MSGRRNQQLLRSPVARRCHSHGAPPPSSKATPTVSNPSPPPPAAKDPQPAKAPEAPPPAQKDQQKPSPEEGEFAGKPPPTPKPRTNIPVPRPTVPPATAITPPAPQQPPPAQQPPQQAFYGDCNPPAPSNTREPHGGPGHDPPKSRGRQQHDDTVVKGLTMELEKLEIQNQNLRDKLDTLQMEKREQERQMRVLEKELDESRNQLKKMEDGSVSMQDKMKDLKLQVREELSRNEMLDQRLLSLEHVQKEMHAKDQRVAELEKQLHETQLLLQYSKKAFSKELTKNKELQQMLEEEKKQRKYDELIVMENETLKGLITAKDSMLTHKSRLIETVKSLVKQYPGVVDTGIIKTALNSDPRALADTEHQNGHTPAKGRFLESFLEPPRKSKLQRAASAKSRSSSVHPAGPQQQDTFSDFRAAEPDGYYQAYKREQVIVKKTLSKDETPPPKNGYTIRRWQTMKVVPASSAVCSNGSTAGSSTGIPVRERPKTAHASSPRLRRSQTQRNTLRPPSAYARSEANSSAYEESKRSATPTSGYMSNGTNGDLDSSMNSASRVSYSSTMDKDIMYLRALKVGDRVIVEVDRIKDDKRLKRRGGIIKFIGQVDKAYDSGRLYTGIRLDEPVGDTDGVFNGKRYFNCTDNHGIFLKVTCIVKVFNKDRSTFCNIEDRIAQLRPPPRHMDMASLV